jgi:XTP/dITP diphosphohydrolase
LIVASRNSHKVRELAGILPTADLQPLPDEVELPPEDGDTFVANALIKARAAREVTGGSVMADDSGLEVDALDGRPGVRSARYAGENASDRENLNKLLAEVASLADPVVARYVCAIAWIDERGRELTFEGRCEGRIVTEPRGQGGFGYDPVFIPDDTPPEDMRTMAELSPREKNSISHRGRAARAMAERLEAAAER